MQIEISEETILQLKRFLDSQLMVLKSERTTEKERKLFNSYVDQARYAANKVATDLCNNPELLEMVSQCAN